MTQLNPSAKVPVLLLKTKSTPGDSYEDLFSRQHSGYEFESTFVPVLHHSFQDAGMTLIRDVLNRRAIDTKTSAAYGGLIFTSQRAVEAFTKLVDEKKGESTLDPPLQVFGEHTGNGDALAKYILDHYSQWYHGRPIKPPVLFLVGEQRRDIIPKTLMAPNLASEKRIQVDEVVVYGTGVMESFPRDFSHILQATEAASSRWVVVFSPTGCDSMLRSLGMLDEATGMGCNKSQGRRKTFIATIGPTTRDYLRKTFAFEPDVCAEEPSPEGVKQGIIQFMDNLKQCPSKSWKGRP
ncbi:Uroporphyrinogen-III synthase [Colletotrichum fructicola Nara gc5]|uniref:Uroporphyrinogen-III synthase n=1 Tax=Colletotrichum fructicola (strain Nara gc5) TaxID=1213859 RepID=A0A7J6J6L3_COLFN|nr:Uroporphyrinogen-III synthase [Colletotrichum fructicola Nara gc5]